MHTCPHIFSHSKPRVKATLFHSFLSSSSLVQIIGHDVLAMSLAQDVRHSHRELLFTVVSVVGHFTNILQENLSVKFLSSWAKNCSFPWPTAFMGWVDLQWTQRWPFGKAEGFWSDCLLWMRHEYDNTRPCYLSCSLGFFRLSCFALSDRLWLSGFP